MDFQKILNVLQKFIAAVGNFLGKIGVSDGTFADAIGGFFDDLKDIAAEAE